MREGKKMILGFHHIAMKAPSAEALEVAVKFYQDQFGFEVWGRYGTEESPKVFLTDGKGRVEFSVFPGYEPEEGTIRHLCIETDDNAEAVAQLEAAGLKVIEYPTPVKHLWPGHSVIMAVVVGPLGETIELVQEVEA